MNTSTYNLRKNLHKLLLLALVPAGLWAGSQVIAQSDTSISVNSHNQPDLAWIYVPQTGGMHVGSGNSDDWTRIKKQGNPYNANYFWVRMENQSYAITDPSLVEQLQAVLKPMQEQGDKMEQLGAQMQRKGDAIQAQTEIMMRNMSQNKENPTAEAAIEKHSLEIDLLSKQMDELSLQMDELSKVHDKLVKNAEEQVLKLTQQAIKSGAAIHLP
ncbi:hypothetical protein [Shewanella acanthi]|uniref:hypothetical protein n=1 Tax=Shewanella acanthi TaxID=2864212 RepID=UPI001C658C0B|nr:hypothetical protein [Shewanella acanthi]QYJ78955.1 hypothetical protein K0H61_00380 [Shewanella acanthi]